MKGWRNKNLSLGSTAVDTAAAAVPGEVADAFTAFEDAPPSGGDAPDREQSNRRQPVSDVAPKRVRKDIPSGQEQEKPGEHSQRRGVAS